MIAVKGIYENGYVTLEKLVGTKESVNIIVIFLEDNNETSSKRLSTSDFSSAIIID